MNPPPLQVLQSIGLFAFQSPPPVFLALAGQLAAVLFAAKLSRSTVASTQEVRDTKTAAWCIIGAFLVHRCFFTAPGQPWRRASPEDCRQHCVLARDGSLLRPSEPFGAARHPRSCAYAEPALTK